MMFGAVVPELRDEADHLMNRLTRLEDIKRESSQARIDARDQIVAVQASQAAIAALLEKRKAVLAEQEKTLAGERSHLRELANRVSNLKQLLAALAEQESAKSAEQHAADAELARQTALLQRPHVRLQHSRGALEYPAQGAILAHFGDDNGLGGVLNGVAISVDAKGLVRSPADASVVFAGPFRSYGQLLILDAGDGYLVLMAGVGQMNVSVGQTVRAGEPLGLMAEKGAPAAVLATGVPDQHAVLYVEIRKNGEPVDSTDWWLGSRKEAMQ
jgi:septal ring factor EnvC (AmiA/AmiB activator)